MKGAEKKNEKVGLSLIIPAYNEEKRIGSVIKEYTRFLESKSLDYELIVVADGQDDTPLEAKKTRNKKLRIIESKERLGKGGGIFTGIRASKGSIIAFVDSDMSVSASDFWKIFSSANKDNCAIGSRRSQGSLVTQKQPFMRRVMSRIFNIYIRTLFGLQISDTQCGAKAFPAEALSKVLDFMRSRGFEFDVELLWRLKKEGLGIIEVPVNWAHEDGSTFSLSHGPRMLFLLFLRRVSI